MFQKGLGNLSGVGESICQLIGRPRFENQYKIKPGTYHGACTGVEVVIIFHFLQNKRWVNGFEKLQKESDIVREREETSYQLVGVYAV